MGYTGEQKREYQRKWMAKRRLAAVEYLGGKCAKCGSEDQLEFDHIERTLKSFNVARLISCKWETIVTELDKCQLLCGQHHLEKTLRERDVFAEHGSHSMYSGQGCRCAKCKAGHAALAKKTRAAGGKW